MVARAEEGGTGASVVVAPTHLGTVAKAELLEGQWRLVKLLGQGLVGQVWQAHDVSLDRAVAVKLMHPSMAADPAQVARFEREGRVLAGLEHPNLLPVLGIGRLGERPFLVTRLLEGKTLAELLHQRGGKLPPAEAARVLVPICEALACLHAAEVVHRDVKPSNVFVGDDQRVTLMDLGSAQEAGSELTQLGAVMGTHGYLSPEQKLGRRGLDGKSDVYAVGCLLLEVLSGKLSTEGEGALGVPRPLAELARFAMAPAPADRPTALELKSKLVPFLITEDPTGPMSSPLLSEAQTRQAIFTPTTGSPSYPQLRAVPSPAPENEEPRVEVSAAAPPAAGATQQQLPTVLTSQTRVLSPLADRGAEGHGPKWVALALTLVGVAISIAFLAQPSPPATPLRPEPIPRELTRTTTPPPPATPEYRAPITLSSEMEARLAAVTTVEVKREQQRPRMRTGRSVTPMKVQRKGLGATDSRVLARVMLVATYGDKPVKAQLEVDGLYRGRTPVELTLAPGDHLIRVDYTKSALTELTTSFSGGQSVRLEIELRTPTEAKQKRNEPMKGARPE